MPDNLVWSLLGNRLTTLKAMRDAYRGEQKAEIIVNLGNRSDRGPRAARCGFLLDGNRRGKPFDRIDVRGFEAVEKLPRIGRKGFDITPLAFRINGIEGEAGFAGTAQASDYSQFVAGNLDVNTL